MHFSTETSAMSDTESDMQLQTCKQSAAINIIIVVFIPFL